MKYGGMVDFLEYHHEVDKHPEPCIYVQYPVIRQPVILHVYTISFGE